MFLPFPEKEKGVRGATKSGSGNIQGETARQQSTGEKEGKRSLT